MQSEAKYLDNAHFVLPRSFLPSVVWMTGKEKAVAQDDREGKAVVQDDREGKAVAQDDKLDRYTPTHKKGKGLYKKDGCILTMHPPSDICVFFEIILFLLENQLSELVQAASPSLPFVSSFRRNIEV